MDGIRHGKGGLQHQNSNAHLHGLGHQIHFLPQRIHDRNHQLMLDKQYSHNDCKQH